jgi:acetyl esterase/lipase
MLAVDYRPAPEAPAGAAASDGLAAVTWLRERADNLGVDPARIAVMGDSAGGGVAASVAILARDHRIPFARQLLVYPMLDPHHRTRPPSRGGAHPLLLRLQPHGVGRRPPRARRDASSGAKHRPARNTNFAGLAPSYIEVGEMDIFRDEDVGYARQLWRAGVSTELHVHPGMPHAFDVLLLGNDLRYQADKNPRHPPRVRPQSRGSTSSAHWAGLARRATPARLPRAVGSDGVFLVWVRMSSVRYQRSTEPTSSRRSADLGGVVAAVERAQAIQAVPWRVSAVMRGVCFRPDPVRRSAVSARTGIPDESARRHRRQKICEPISASTTPSLTPRRRPRRPPPR